jgi:hypothetical protein
MVENENTIFAVNPVDCLCYSNCRNFLSSSNNRRLFIRSVHNHFSCYIKLGETN